MVKDRVTFRSLCVIVKNQKELRGYAIYYSVLDI